MTASKPINVNPIEIEHKASEYLAVVVSAQLSRVTVDPALEASNRATVDGEVYIRYNRSSYPVSEFFPGDRDRRLYFQLFTSVIDRCQHEAALLVHNSCLGLLTGWRPQGDQPGTCHDAVLEGMRPETDSFASFKNGLYKYQAELSILTTHAKLTPRDILEQAGIPPGDIDDILSGNDNKSPLERAIEGGDPILAPVGGFVLRFGLWRSPIGQLGVEQKSSRFSDLNIRDPNT